MARRVRAFAIAVTAVLVTAAAVVVASSAAQAVTIDTNAWYQIVSRHSGKALAISGGSTADQAGLVQMTLSSATSQQFQFVSSGGGYYRLRARHSGKVVDVLNFSTANGATIMQWPDTN